MTYEPPLHPEYTAVESELQFWRESYEGGENYKTHLEKFSYKEDNQDFQSRKDRSYVPNFCKSLVNEIKNAIYRPMKDITRSGGTDLYQEAVRGLGPGVDKLGSSMNMFIGDLISELLFMGKVGVFVDAPQEVDEDYRPYLYAYKREDILNWVVSPDNPDEYQSVLLRRRIYTNDEETNYPKDTAEIFLNIVKDVEAQTVSITEIDAEGEETVFDLPGVTTIPFHMFDIGDSLIKDLVDYQKALYNLESTDLNFLTQSNFPFYVEQYDFDTHSFGKGFDEDFGDESDGDDTVGAPGTTNSDTTTPDKAGETRAAKSGVAGRRYGKGLNSPGYIHPSSEPVKASMAKQEKMKQDMRQLLNLTIENLNPQRISTKSKEQEREGLMAGLSFIGQILLKGETRIEKIWAEYEGKETQFNIQYPENYVVKSVAETIAEVDSLVTLTTVVPSATYTSEIYKIIAKKMLETRISDDMMQTILSEIDSTSGQVIETTTTETDTETETDNLSSEEVDDDSEAN